MHTVFQLYDVLRFDSTVVINVLINISSLKVKQPNFLMVKHRVHECASGLNSTPKAELFMYLQTQIFIGQKMSKFVNYKVKILSFYVKKLVASGMFKGRRARHLPRPPLKCYARTFSLFLVKNLLSTHVIYYKADHK